MYQTSPAGRQCSILELVCSSFVTSLGLYVESYSSLVQTFFFSRRMKLLGFGGCRSPVWFTVLGFTNCVTEFPCLNYSTVTFIFAALFATTGDLILLIVIIIVHPSIFNTQNQTHNQLLLLLLLLLFIRWTQIFFNPLGIKYLQ